MSDRPLPAHSNEVQTSDHGVRERAAETGRASDLPRYPRSDTHAEAGGGQAAGPPRWVTLAVILIVAVLVLGFIFLHLSGGLGPGLHGGG